jgi:hypothetical protein
MCVFCVFCVWLRVTIISITAIERLVHHLLAHSFYSQPHRPLKRGRCWQDSKRDYSSCTKGIDCHHCSTQDTSTEHPCALRPPKVAMSSRHKERVCPPHWRSLQASLCWFDTVFDTDHSSFCRMTIYGSFA